MRFHLQRCEIMKQYLKIRDVLFHYEHDLNFMSLSMEENVIFRGIISYTRSHVVLASQNMDEKLELVGTLSSFIQPEGSELIVACLDCRLLPSEDGEALRGYFRLETRWAYPIYDITKREYLVHPDEIEILK